MRARYAAPRLLTQYSSDDLKATEDAEVVTICERITMEMVPLGYLNQVKRSMCHADWCFNLQKWANGPCAPLRVGH
jgi:hypothetical protein